MTIEKYTNTFRLFRLTADELRSRLNDLYSEPRTPETSMKQQALERLLRERR